MAGVAILLVVFGAVVYAAVRGALYNEMDSTLTTTIHTLASSIEFDEGELDVQFDPGKIPEFQKYGQEAYFQIWLKDGRALKRSDSLGRENLPNFHGNGVNPEFRSIKLADGRIARAAGIEFTPGSEYRTHYGEDEEYDEGRHTRSKWNPPCIALVVARDVVEIEAHLTFLKWLLLGAGAASMALAALVSLVLVHRGLAPLVSIADDISAIRADDLDAHVSTEKMPLEILPVAEKLNDFLRRIKDAFEREKCFSADMAHELRTPLAGLKTTLEVALSRERGPEEYRESLMDCLDVANRMNALVEKLLLLARIEGNKAERRIEEIRISEIIDDCWKPFAEDAAAKNISFENRFDKNIACKSDRGGLIMVFTNILENAAQYADAGGKIWVEGTMTAEIIQIEISNTGCRLTKEDVLHVFERFWRAESSRTETGVHLGIGLSFVERIVQSLGGKADARATDAGVFTIKIALPQNY
jgi:signal transduction histidine kinase